ncbi:MAG TPA: hypothetical protein VHK91_00330 [Flavisolibacter sp.]|nr:hypothetical protein [Flavisolibacter sp.]
MKEWYLRDDWDPDVEKEFEEKLKRSRGNYNKAQYLRIKGSRLIKSNDLNIQIVGCELLKRVAKDYPNEYSNVMFAFEQLGDYYFGNKDYTNAEEYYRKSITFYKDHGRSGSSGFGDIKLVETLVEGKKVESFQEGYTLLTKEFKETDGSLILNDEIFRYYTVLAKICKFLNKYEEAKSYAELALQKTIIGTPQLDKYPNLGLVKASEADLDILKEIAGIGYS